MHVPAVVQTTQLRIAAGQQTARPWLTHHPSPHPQPTNQPTNPQGELVSSYTGLRESEARGPPIVNSIVAAARQCNLDRDIPELPSEDTDCKTLDLEARDNIVGACAAALCCKRE